MTVTVNIMKDGKLATRSRAGITELRSQVIDSALEVHKNIGLGFGKQEYSQALSHELSLRDIPYERMKKIELSYKGSVAGEYELDFIVQESLVVMISTDNNPTGNDETRLKSIMRANRLKSGLTINFSKDILEIGTVER
jgi:GxxExxY protein